MSTNRVTPANEGKEFARWFTSLREDIGSQDEAAEKIGVSRITLARWEGGKYLPSAKHIPLIAKVFAVSDEEVARRAGVILESKVSERSLSLARLIESRLPDLPEDRWQAAMRGIDSFLMALSPPQP